MRLGLDADWDRMEHIANYDILVRQMLGVPTAPCGEASKTLAQHTLRDNEALLEEELLNEINARLTAAGREVFAKKDGALGWSSGFSQGDAGVTLGSICQFGFNPFRLDVMLVALNRMSLPPCRRHRLDEPDSFLLAKQNRDQPGGAVRGGYAHY